MVVTDNLQISLMNSHIPAQMGPQIGVLRHWQDGPLLVGASSLTGRYWNGSVWYFEDSDAAPDVQKCVTGHELESGVCDARAFSQNKIVVGLDSGTIEFLEIVVDPTINESPMFSSVAYSCEHDDAVHSIDVTNCNLKVVSGGWDRCIKVSEIETLSSKLTYRDAHSQMIWMVACHPKENDLFTSCSQDGTIRLWDTRLPRPATQLGKNSLNQVVTAIAWNPESTNEIVCGDQTGKIWLLDIRQDDSVQSLITHKNRINQIAFAPHMPNCFATCADETKVVVACFNGSDEKILEDELHSDFVCGLSWHPLTHKLYSCGFDSSVKNRSVQMPMNCCDNDDNEL